MATITFTIPDAALPDVLDALSIPYGWVQGGGQTKAQVARATLRAWLIDQTAQWKAEQAAVTARATADAATRTALSTTSVA